MIDNAIVLVTMLEDRLVEILLFAVFFLNVGAYAHLRNRINTMEKEQGNVEETVRRLVNRMFGLDEDPTAEGHLVETEERFDVIDEKLEQISSQIESVDESRKEEHQMVRNQLEKLVEKLSKEDNVGIEKEEFEFDD